MSLIILHRLQSILMSVQVCAHIFCVSATKYVNSEQSDTPLKQYAVYNNGDNHTPGRTHDFSLSYKK